MTSSRRFGFSSLRCSAKHNKASVVKATDPHLQIHNQAIKYFAMESLKKCKIMDCHEIRDFLAMAQRLVLCHCEVVRSTMKQSTLAQGSLCDGIFQIY